MWFVYFELYFRTSFFILKQFVYMSKQYIHIFKQFVYISNQIIYTSKQFVYISMQFVYNSRQFIYISMQFVYISNQFVYLFPAFFSNLLLFCWQIFSSSTLFHFTRRILTSWFCIFFSRIF